MTVNMDLVLNAIGQKHRAEYAAASTIFAMGIGAQATVTVTIPQGFTLYMLTFGGYATVSDILAEFKDPQGGTLFDYEEWPDTFFQENYIPFLQQSFRVQQKIVFTNQNAGTSNILVYVSGLLLPDEEVKAFEADLMKMAPR